jgi:putative redox protein
LSVNASAQRISGFRHIVRVRQHRLNVDEPADAGGDDAAPSPQELLAASLASCTAVTMEMYAQRKGWDLSDVEVECEYVPAERGCPT